MPTAVLVACLYSVPYMLRCRTLRGRGRPVAPARRAAFAAAVAVLAGSALIPGRRLTGHMGEHLLLGDVVPLLLVLGCTGAVLAPVLRMPAARRLTHPVVALPLWAGALYVWHLPALYVAAVDVPVVHALQHACFLLTGVNVWMAILGPLPRPAWFGTPAKLGAITAWWLLGSVVGGVLVFAAGPLYSAYPGVASQSAAGALMMVEQSAVAVTLFCGVFLSLFREEGDRQELRELAAARGVLVPEAQLVRAPRAVRHRLERE